MRYIDKIGFEVEGGWHQSPNFRIHHDGSVNVAAYTVGEYASKALDTVAEVAKDIVRCYPDEKNSSCGFHVHVSLKSLSDYSRLMSSGFHNMFYEKLKEFSKTLNDNDKELLRPRMGGSNRYCMNMQNSAAEIMQRQSEQVDKESVRYYALNFCYSLHGTLECRVFPMFSKPMVAIAAMKMFIGCINDYLDTREARLVVKESIKINTEVDQLCV